MTVIKIKDMSNYRTFVALFKFVKNLSLEHSVKMDATTTNIPKKLPQFISAIAACTGAMAAGCTNGWFNLIQKEFETTGYNGIIFTTSDSGWAGSILLLAALFMSLAAGYIADLIGRKIIMLAMIAPLTIGWLFIIFAQNKYMIFVGRFITGLSLGTFCVVAPMYTSEIADDRIRGALGTFFQLFFVFGILTMSISGYVCSILIHNIFGASMGLIFFIFFFFQPESPVYLVKKNKMKDAEAALQKLRGKDYDVTDELKEIQKCEETLREQKVHIRQALKTNAAKKSIIIVFGCQYIQQLSGINALAIYTADVISSAGVKENVVPFGVMGMTIVNILAINTLTFIIDKFGRKTLLLISAAALALAMLVFGLYMMIQERELANVTNVAFLAILVLVVFSFAFGIGLGPIPWLLAPEVFPPGIKALMCSLAGAFSWLLGFLVSRYYLLIAEAIGTDICLYFFACNMAAGSAFIYFYVFETKGKSLEEIQNMMNK